MNKNLQVWLSQFVKFGPISYGTGVDGLVVDLFISDKCNLLCKHCYFGDTQTIGDILTVRDWKSVIDALYANGIRHFHISGKESSLDSRVVEIVSYIKKIEGTYSGIVSNGTGQLHFYKELINEGIDYLEFSLDGTEKTHNYVRGKNVFSQVIDTLESLSSWSDIIDISTCLNKNSYDEYFTLIDILQNCGIRKFFAAPFLAKGNGKTFVPFSISPLVFSQILEKSFTYLESNPEKSMVLKFCIPHGMTFPMIEKSTFFNQILVNYLTGKSDLIYSVCGNLMQISLDLFDIKFLHNISITSDGEVIPCADYICNKNYARYSIGNVMKTDVSAIMQVRADLINNNLKNYSYEKRKQNN